jgi:hypothetical protein
MVTARAIPGAGQSRPPQYQLDGQPDPFVKGGAVPHVKNVQHRIEPLLPLFWAIRMRKEGRGGVGNVRRGDLATKASRVGAGQQRRQHRHAPTPALAARQRHTHGPLVLCLVLEGREGGGGNAVVRTNPLQVIQNPLADLGVGLRRMRPSRIRARLPSMRNPGGERRHSGSTTNAPMRQSSGCRSQWRRLAWRACFGSGSRLWLSRPRFVRPHIYQPRPARAAPLLGVCVCVCVCEYVCEYKYVCVCVCV